MKSASFDKAASKRGSSVLQKEFADLDKKALLEKNKETIKNTFTSDKDKEIIANMPLGALHKVFKGLGFGGTKNDLLQILDELGLRKKKPIQWLSGIESFKKCEFKKEDGSICGGNLLSLKRMILDIIGHKYLQYPFGEFVKFLSNHENKNVILYQIDKAYNKHIDKKYYYCSHCNNYFILEKKNGKNKYLLCENKNGFFDQKISVISKEIYAVLVKLGVIQEKKEKPPEQTHRPPSVSVSAS